MVSCGLHNEERNETMKNMIYILPLLLLVSLASCSEEVGYEMMLPGHWRQVEATCDGESVMKEAEKELTILFEANGIYRMYDPCAGMEHAGTWLYSNEEWLNVSMDKILGKNSSDGSFRYGQVLVRFTILQLTRETLELRIKTFLGERKKLIMFSQMEQDGEPATEEERLALDTENKKTHTYIYKFTRVK